MAKKIKAAHIKKIIEFDNETQCEMYLSEKLGAKVLDRKVDDATGKVTILVLELYSHAPMLDDSVNLLDDKDGLVTMTYVITRKGQSVNRIPFHGESSCSGCGAVEGKLHQYNCKKKFALSVADIWLYASVLLGTLFANLNHKKLKSEVNKMIEGKAKGRWVYFQPNDKDLKDKYGDCTIRALCKALNCTWIEAFDKVLPFMRKSQCLWNSAPHKLVKE